MKNEKAVVVVLAMVLTFSGVFRAHAQAQSSGAPDSVVQIAADAQGLSQVPMDQLPRFGTFWVVLNDVASPVPVPFIYQDSTNAPVIYSLGVEGQFLQDNTGGAAPQPSWRQAQHGLTSAMMLQQQGNAVLDLITQVQTQQLAEQAAAGPVKLAKGGHMSKMDMGDGAGGETPPAPTPSVAYGTNLWLELWQPGTNAFNADPHSLTLILHNTQSGVNYQVLSQVALPGTNWNSEGFVLGSATTNWTPATVPIGTRTNTLFLKALSWIDSQGTGIPDWWWLKYVGYIGNSYALDSSGDGWTYLQDYNNGFVPGTFNTPPPPTILSAVLNSAATQITLTWRAGGGAVADFGIEDSYVGEVTTVGPNTFTATIPVPDNSPGGPYDYLHGDPYIEPTLQVRSYFTNGVHVDSLPWTVSSPTLTLNAQVVRGNGGQPYLALAAPPPNLAFIRLSWISPSTDTVAQWFDFPASNLVSGVMQIPTNAWIPYFGQNSLQLMAFTTNGTFGPSLPLLTQTAPEELWDVPFYNFVDARSNLTANLKFLLRAATGTNAFSYASDIQIEPGSAPDPEFAYLRGASPTAYECYGFHTFSPLENYSFLQEDRPVQENFLWRNFVFNTADTNSDGVYSTGQGGSGANRTLTNPKYEYTGSGTASPLPLAFSSANATLLYFPSDNLTTGDMGFYTNNSGIVTLANNVFNNYGLRLNSASFLSTNGYVSVTSGGAGAYFVDSLFVNADQPALSTVGYYFASETPFFNYIYGFSSGSPQPLPGSPNFSVASTSPLLITGFGQQITVSGWAKQQIVNGYTGKYAYLEQYFDKAYTLGTNGVATTNSAGVLSPYGEFFPTMPGPAALVTMPDIDTGQRGTGVVQVVKLQLDVNHDGVMDLSFGGSDNTSARHPFLFWLNNDYDRLAFDADDNTNYEDSVETAIVPDCNFTNTFGNRIIPTQRDLEDFARLWVVGVSNFLSGLPSGSTVTLSWGDMGSPNYSNPTIDLFQAADADGGIGYLTNSTIAAQQINPSNVGYVGRLGPGQSIQLNSSFFANHWAGDHFIWCGAQSGSGQLILTIASGTNVLAQTSTWIQLTDIKQMYERWTVGDSPTNTPLTVAHLASEDLPPPSIPFQYATNSNTSTPYILFVHGWNMQQWEKDRFAESAFKRLYWQGYQGRFGSFRWPTDFGFTGDFNQLLTDPQEKDNFDNSEFQAWKSATGLLNKLNDLNVECPGHVYVLAHSMGNLVTGEALRLAGTNQVVNTYVASQAAVTAHAYDETISNYSFNVTLAGVQFSFGPHTPNIYGDWFTSNNGGGAERAVSFYNTNDFALSRLHWQLDELFKPDLLVAAGGSLWAYGYNGSTNDPAPWNHFKTNLLANTTVNFDIVTSLTNRYEVMAYAAQSYTTALGATPSVLNLNRNVDLTRSSPSRVWPPDSSQSPYSAHFWHSAEFRGDYPQMQGYWSELLGTEALNLK